MSLERIRVLLRGKKTYLLAITAIITVLVAWAQGDLSNVQAIEALFAAFATMSLRAGISKSGPVALVIAGLSVCGLANAGTILDQTAVERAPNIALGYFQAGFELVKQKIDVGVTETFAYKDSEFENTTSVTVLGKVKSWAWTINPTWTVDGDIGVAYSYAVAWGEHYVGVGAQLAFKELPRELGAFQARIPVVGQITPQLTRLSVFAALGLRVDNDIGNHPQPAITVGITFPMN